MSLIGKIFSIINIRSRRENYYKYFVLLILFIGVFYKTLGITYINGDDIRGFIVGNTPKYGIEWIWGNSAGRLTMFFWQMLQYLPYRIFGSNIYLIRVFNSLFILLSVLLFSILIDKLFRKSYFKFVIPFVYICFLQISFPFNLTICYPWATNIYLISILISILLFLYSIRHNNNKILIISSLLYLISLFIYETSVIFILFYIFIYIKEINSNEYLKNKKYALAIFIPLIIFLIVYLIISKILFPIQYDGARIGGINIKNIFRTLIVYSFYMFPGRLFFNLEDKIHNFYQYNIRLDAFNIIKCLMVSIICYKLINSINKKGNKRDFIEISIFATMFIFLPTILLSLTPMHQQFAQAGGGYVVSNISYFGIILFIINLIIFIIEKINEKYIKNILAIFISCICMVVSCITDISNNIYIDNMLFATKKYSIAENFFSSDIVKENIDSDDITIYAPSLWNNRVDIGYSLSPEYDNINGWSDFANIFSNKNINVIFNEKDLQNLDEYLIFDYDQSMDEYYSTCKVIKNNKLEEIYITSSLPDINTFVINENNIIDNQVISNVNEKWKKLEVSNIELLDKNVKIECTPFSDYSYSSTLNTTLNLLEEDEAKLDYKYFYKNEYVNKNSINNSYKINSKGIVYGPYITMKKGKYTVKYEFDNYKNKSLDGLSLDIVSNEKNKQFFLESNPKLSDDYYVEIELEEDMPSVEFRIFNNSNESIEFKSISIERKK